MTATTAHCVVNAPVPDYLISEVARVRCVSLRCGLQLNSEECPFARAASAAGTSAPMHQSKKRSTVASYI